MKFNIDAYHGKYAMLCKTEKEAKDFRDYMTSVGYHSSALTEYADIVSMSEEYELECATHIAYEFNNCDFHIDRCLKEAGYKILNWSDFMDREEPDASKESDSHTEESLKPFTKADLKTGDVVLHRCGVPSIFIKEFGVFVLQRGWVVIGEVDSDLRSNENEDFDIVEVRRPKREGDCNFAAIDQGWGDLVYKREDPVEMTLSEVCKLLGKTIRIVPEP